MKFSFTVPTEDVCVLCLKKCPPGVGVGSAKLSNFQPISHFLGLDLREIFNIKREKPLPLVGEDGEEVVIEVTLCGSCGAWRKAFCDMYREWRGLERRMEESVRGMREVMVGAERDVKKVKEYLLMRSVGGGGEERKSLDVVRGSIPEKFRKETISKSALRKELVKKEKKEEEVIEADLHCDEDLATSDVEGDGEEEEEELDAEAEWKLMEELGSGNSEESLHLETINSSPDAKNDDEDDDEEDPEELMMRYHSMAESNERSSGDELIEDPLGMGNKDEEMEVDESIFIEQITGPSSSTSTSTSFSRVTTPSPGKSDKLRIHRPGSFGANFTCEVCGRVLVSRKNFELHQRRHAGEKPFECEYCEKTFRDTSNLRSHVLRYHRHFLFMRYKDPAISPEAFKAGLDHLVQSILSDSTPDDESSSRVSQGCQLCKRVYTQRFAIEDHIVQRHYDVLGMSIADLQMEISTLSKEECLFYMTQIMADGNTARACGACSTIFPDADALVLHVKSHIRVHLVRNQNKVTVNSSKIPSADGKSLIQLKLKCEPCGRYFEDLQALNNHKQMGVGQGGCRFSTAGKDPLVQCEHCGKCLNNVGSHRRHLLSLHRYQVFAKYLPEGAKPVEVEEMIKQIFEERKPERGTDGFKCFVCDKIITQYRKLSSHVLVSHFREMVKLVNKGLREQKQRRNKGQVESQNEQVLDLEEKEVEVIELDDDEESEDPDTPKILRLVDSNGEEIQLGSGEGQVEQYLNGLGSSGVVHRLVEEVEGDNNIKIEYEYGAKFT